LLGHGLKPLAVLATEPGLANREIASLVGKLSPVVLSESVFRSVVDAENPPGIAAEIQIPARKEEGGDRVFLEGVQDPGNVGTIIRSAAAFGVRTVILDRDCADAWSPKALRAGMGGQFVLQILEVENLADQVERFEGRVVCTLPRQGVELDKADLTGTLGWLFGSEGKGVSARLQEKADLRITIPTVPATESLNVAAAAAICLHARFTRSRK
jgi:TrmH family RNA methyltransferase